MPAFINPTQVRFIDVDSFGHVNNAVFISYFELARVRLYTQNVRERLPLDLANEVGVNDSFEDLVGPGTNYLLVSGQRIEYVTPLALRMDDVDVLVWCSRVGSSSFDLDYEVREQTTDVVYAKGQTGMVQASRATGRPVALSAVQKQFLCSWEGPPVQFRDA